MKHGLLLGALLLSACTTAAVDDDPELGTSESELSARLPNNLPLPNELGFASTWSGMGSVDLQNDFFKNFGTNGRSCGSCHSAAEGWTVSVTGVKLRFLFTAGRDPIFRPVDGTNSPTADVSTYAARLRSYSMLLNRGTIRVGLPVPTDAEFELTAVDDPYGFASAAELSMFRRPLPATNLMLTSTVMWDGRVTGATLTDALSAQADGATLGHAQAITPLTPEANQEVVDFESSNFTAQLINRGGRTDQDSGLGGATNLAGQEFVAGRFNLFDGWQTSTNPKHQAAYRGQELFNTRKRTTGGGACAGCHSAENSGTSQRGGFFDIGVAHADVRTADLPLYTFTNKTTGEVLETSDPGRALITGLWKDMMKFKTPSMRGLAARAPYFHNGSARTLLDIVKFYETSLSFAFTPDEESDLVEFMASL